MKATTAERVALQMEIGGLRMWAIEQACRAAHPADTEQAG